MEFDVPASLVACGCTVSNSIRWDEVQEGSRDKRSIPDRLSHFNPPVLLFIVSYRFLDNVGFKWESGGIQLFNKNILSLQS